MAEDSMQLQQLIDDSLRAGIGAEELHPARVRLQALHAREFNEGMLSAAASGDTCAVREKLRTGGDSDAQQQSTGFSLWHIAASRGDAKLAGVARSCNASVELLDRSGWTALMLASAQLDCVLVQALLAAEADLTARSDQGEVIVDCQTKLGLILKACQCSTGLLNPQQPNIIHRNFISEPPHSQTLHTKPQTPNPKPQTPNPKPQTPNPKPQTPNPKPQTPNPKPQTPNPSPGKRSWKP